MKVITLCIVACLFLPLVQSVQFCHDFTDQGCAACTIALSGSCGFCYATQQCLPGNASMPSPATNEKCQLGWMFEASQCPNCPASTNCMDCNAQQSCGWCPPTDNEAGKCVDTSTATCLWDHQCACGKYEHCDECLEKSHCSWCAERNTCENTFYSSCKQWTHTCPACPTLTQCVDCNNQFGCTWCKHGDRCLASTQCAETDQVPACDAFCETLTKCDECANQYGCGWCSKKKRCYGQDGTDSDGCLLTHTCDIEKTGGFDGGSFAGGMFLIIGLVIVGAGVFWGYRFYQRRNDAQYIQ